MAIAIAWSSIATSPATAGPNPPTNTTPPTVTGTPRYQQTLTAQGGTWTGAQPITVTRQWQRCLYDHYPSAVLLAQPKSYWGLSDAVGDPAYDSYGESDGTYVAGVSLGATGVMAANPDTAATFDGTTGFVDLPSVQFDSADFAIEGWFKVAVPATPGEFPGRIWSSGYAGGSQGVQLVVNTNSLAFRVTDASGATAVAQTAQGYSNGAWHSVVAVRSGTSFLVYVDGVQAASATGSLGDVDAPSAPTRIGAAVPPVVGENFRGDLDEMSIYGRALSSAEVAQHRKEALGIACSDVVGATATTYVLQAADAGFAMRVVETASNQHGTASAPSSQVGPVRAVLTYQQLQAAGLPLPASPANIGLPACPEELDWPGYATGDELDAAISQAPEEPTCADDPTQYLFAYGVPLQPGDAQGTFYRHMGAITTVRYQGGKISVEVSDPDVNHNTAGLEQVNPRTLAKRTPGRRPPWTEIGWIEWSEHPQNEQFTYMYASPENRLHLIPRIPPNGRWFGYRVRDCEAGVCVNYFWNGRWRRVPYRNESMHCMTPTRSRNCFIEEFLEVFSDTGHWPDMNAPFEGPGVDFERTKLRTAPGTWVLWDSTHPTRQSQDAQTTPYRTCWTPPPLVIYHKFKAGKVC